MNPLNYIYTILQNRSRDELVPNGIHVESYSQYGDDLIVDAILGCKEKGFYVDIGANDPVTFSNTRRFYAKGWRGITIEPNPMLSQKLSLYRPGDTVLNKGIGTVTGKFPFYVVSADMLSSFDEKDARRNCMMFGESIVKVIEIEIVTLGSVISKVGQIDFMSIDVEGRELDVIMSNNWDRYRPKVVSMEVFYHGNALKEFMNHEGYELVYVNKADGIFVDKRCKL